MVNPGMVNATGWPTGNVPPVKVTVKTSGPVPDSAAVPAAPVAGARNATAGAPARFKPAPVSVMRILPGLGTATPGVSVTVIVTPVTPLTLLLRLIES